jgi:hypothetical protein
MESVSAAHGPCRFDRPAGRDGVAPALIVADQHGADLEVALGWAGAAAPGKAIQEFERGTVECAKSLFLNPVGDHPPQKVRREVFRGRAPERRLPAPPQRMAGQPIAECETENIHLFEKKQRFGFAQAGADRCVEALVRLMVRREIGPAEVTASCHGQTSAKPRAGRSQAKPAKPIVPQYTCEVQAGRGASDAGDRVRGGRRAAGPPVELKRQPAIGRRIRIICDHATSRGPTVGTAPRRVHFRQRTRGLGAGTLRQWARSGMLFHVSRAVES